MNQPWTFVKEPERLSPGHSSRNWTDDMTALHEALAERYEATLHMDREDPEIRIHFADRADADTVRDSVDAFLGANPCADRCESYRVVGCHPGGS